jgi:hypothetical protein
MSHEFDSFLRLADEVSQGIGGTTPLDPKAFAKLLKSADLLIPPSIWMRLRRAFTVKGLPFFQFYIDMRRISLGGEVPKGLKTRYKRAADRLAQVRSPIDGRPLSPVSVNAIALSRPMINRVIGGVEQGRTDPMQWGRFNAVMVGLLIQIARDKSVFIKPTRQVGRERWATFRKMSPKQERVEKLRDDDPESFALMQKFGETMAEIDGKLEQKIADAGKTLKKGFLAGRPVLLGVDPATGEEMVYDRDGDVTTKPDFFTKVRAKSESMALLSRVPHRTSVPPNQLRLLDDEEMTQLEGDVEWSSITDDKAKQGKLTRLFPTKRIKKFIHNAETNETRVEEYKVVAEGRYKGIFLDDLINSEGRLIEGTAYAYDKKRGQETTVPVVIDPSEREPYVSVAEVVTKRQFQGKRIKVKTKKLYLKIDGTRQNKELRNALKKLACNAGTKSGCIPSVSYEAVKGSRAAGFYFDPKDFGVVMDSLQGMSLSTAALEEVKGYYKDLAAAEAATKNLEAYEPEALASENEDGEQFRFIRGSYGKSGDWEPFELREKQKEAIAWMDANGNSGVCALETGVGKTATSIGMMLKLVRDGLAETDSTYTRPDGVEVQTNGRFLYVCPPNLRGNIKKELRGMLSNSKAMESRLDVLSYAQFSRASKTGTVPRQLQKVPFWKERVGTKGKRAIDEFNFFPDAKPYVPQGADKYRIEVERKLGGHPEALAAPGLLKPAGASLVAENRLYYWRNKAWLIQVDAKGKNEAAAKGKRVQKNLAGKRSLRASDPYLHHIPLYVVFNEGWVALPGIPEKAKKDGPSLADLKFDIVRTSKDFFGSRSSSLSGKAGAYTLNIAPAKREHKGVFRPFRISGSLPEIQVKLDEAIEKVQAATSGKRGGYAKQGKAYKSKKAFDAALYAGIFFDEAQAMKNPTSQTSQAALKLHHPRKVCLTASPMERNPMEAYVLAAITNNTPLFGRSIEARGNRKEMRRFKERFCEIVGGRIVGVKQDPLVQRDLHTWVKRNVFHADKTEVKEYNLPKPTVTSTPIEMPPEVEAIYRDVATQFSVVLEGAARKFRERKKTDSYGDRQAEKVFSRMLAPIIKLLTDMANRPAKALRDVAFAIDNGYLPDFVTPVKPDGTGGEPRALPKQFMSVLRQWQEQHSAEDLEAMADQVGNPKLKAAEDTIVAKIERAKGSRSLLFSDDKAMCMEAGQHMAETMTGTHVVGLNDGIHFFRGTTELERLVYPLDTALLAKLVKDPEERKAIMAETGGVSIHRLPFKKQALKKHPAIPGKAGVHQPYLADDWQQFVLKEIVNVDPDIKTATLQGKIYMYGHNLQGFNTVVHLDRNSWNSESMKQRTARAWRQGQDQVVDEVNLDLVYAADDEGVARDENDVTLDQIRKSFQEMDAGIFDRIIKDAQGIELGAEWEGIDKKDASLWRLDEKVAELMLSPMMGRVK